MHRRWAGWIIPALTLGLVATALYGFNENQLRTASVVQVENGYQGALHGLAFDIDEMQDGLARALVTTAPRMIMNELRTAGRYANMATVYAGQLPSNLQGNGTLTGFLNQVVSRTDDWNANLADGRSIRGQDLTAMEVLYRDAGRLERQIRAIQAGVLANGRTLTPPAGISTWTLKRPAPSTLVTQFSHLNASARAMLSDLTETRTNGINLQHAYGSLVADTGPTISEGRAMAIARSFAGVGDSMPATATKLGSGFPYSGYLVTLGSTQNAEPSITVSVASHRGSVIWMVSSYKAGTSNFDMVSAQKAARQFLIRHGYSHVAIMKTDSYGGRAVFHFAPVVSGVQVYTQPITVQVSLGSGVVTSFNATNYLLNPMPAISLRPALPASGADQSVSTRYRVEGTHLALIELANHQPALVYDVLGRTADNTFRIYVSAQTGRQVGIEKLTKDETSSLTD